jgi:tetrahydromethanopterin S-methyltransferase subunit A
MATPSDQLTQIEIQLREAIQAKKCWRCGCYQDTVDALRQSARVNETFEALLTEAQSLYETKRYDCLGCDTCWPAVAQNLAGELDPAIAEGSHCATSAPETREGWPPLPGDYHASRFQAPVAVCTLNSDQLSKALSATPIEGLSIVGTLHTENLGIERLVRNVLANPHIRFLVVCGEDTRKTIGHLPGQSLVALAQHGVDATMRITEAKGKRPQLKNITAQHVDAFRQQIQIIDQIGNCDLPALQELIATTANNDPGPFTDSPVEANTIPVEVAKEPDKLVLDPAGYFVVYPDRTHRCLTLEHYRNNGVLDRILTATSATALYSSVIDAKLISRLDHAAYLGRELARAEHALETGEVYVQDRAPGEINQSSNSTLQPKATACGCHSTKGDSCC